MSIARSAARTVPSQRGASYYRSSATDDDRAALAGGTSASASLVSLREAIRGGVHAGLRSRALFVPADDARLDAAMDDLAGGLAPDDLPAADTVAFLLAHYGIVEPSPHWLIERTTPGDQREISQRIAADVVTELASAPAARLGIGIARAPDELRVVIALQESNLQLEPVPRQLARGAGASIAGRLAPRYRDPQLVVTAPAGSVRELPVAVASASPNPTPTPTQRPRFKGTLRCGDGAGRYQVEITGVDDSGPTVLANFPVYCGVAPPRDAPGPAGTPRVALGARQAEQRILSLVNRDRAAAGLPALALDARLSEVARAHSRDMAEHDFVAHVSSTTGTVVDRVGRAGLDPALLLENVGRAYSADDAQSGFMSSPGHRANVLDRRATRIGVGVVVGREVSGASPLLVTQLMM